jgi:protein-disulfide isomerase
MTYELNAADLAKMTAREVADLADVDFYAVRDKGFRRQNAAEKKIAKLQKQLAAAKAKMTEAGVIIEAAFREQSRAA